MESKSYRHLKQLSCRSDVYHRVSYAGNSWLSQTQWYIGAEQPPHLACLAPWEGWSDLYNDDAMRGGIPSPEFQQALLTVSSPNIGRAENIEAMVAKYPLWNQYWEDRKAKLDRINVPLYVTASWTNLLHTRGTFKGYLGASSKDKWLRVHNSHEWPDLYYPQNTEDLRKFYDYYLKGIKNDWIYTPKVRMCVLNPGDSDLINRPENEFPLARQIHKKMFLDCAKFELQMQQEVSNASSTSFDGPTGKVEFFYTASEDMELVGFFSLKLWVEAVDTDDLDLFVKISKMGSDGTLLETTCIDAGYLQPDPEASRQLARDKHQEGDKSFDLFFSEGSTGRLRVSHRELNEAKSTPSEPVYTHRKEQKLSPGEIIPVVIEMWPHGMLWSKGQKLKLTVSGYNTRPEHLPHLKPPTYNKGTAVIHAGGKYDSYVLVPFIPAP
jgi:predicted acyl esterase